MGIGVSIGIGPPKQYEPMSVEVLPASGSHAYIVKVELAVFIRDAVDVMRRRRLLDVTLTVGAASAQQWVEAVLGELLHYDPHELPGERAAMMRAIVPALPKRLGRLLLKAAMRRRSRLRQKLRRNAAQRHKIGRRHFDTDAFFEARSSHMRARVGLAEIERLMDVLGKYLPSRLRPRRSRPQSAVMDRSDCIKPTPPPPSE